MVIIHAASPISVGTTRGERHYQETNVEGTRNLLRIAVSSGHVRAFIYTSSADVIDASSHELATEDTPMYTITSRADYYAKSKAIADQLVLDANGRGGMRALCLRPTGVYGERDSQVIPGFLQVLRDGRHRYQIGDNTSLIDFASAGNAALAHVLAVKALLSNTEKGIQRVDGEAFLFTDGSPLPFWSFAHKIWAAAGVKLDPGEVTVVPAWLMLSLASLAEWIFWAFTFGLKRPKILRRQAISYTCLPKTYPIAKARKHLAYNPLEDRDEHVLKGVNWTYSLSQQRSSPLQKPASEPSLLRELL